MKDRTDMLPALLCSSAQACFSAMSQCVQVFTPTGHLLFINPAGIVALEIEDATRIYGTSWQEIWPEGPRDQLQHGMDQALQGEAVKFLSFCSTMKGAPRWWDKAISPLYEDGRITHILWIAHDITSLKDDHHAALEEAKQGKAMLRTLSLQLATESQRLVEMQQRVRQESKTKLLGEFVGNVVHDINNVLSVLNAAFTMLGRHSGPELSADVLHAGQDAIQRGGGLVRQLLDFAREDGQGPMTARVSQLLEANRGMLGAMVGPSIQLVVTVSEDDWPVAAKPGAIESVLFNLAANARDAMPEGGMLQVSALPAEPGELPDGLAPGDYVIVEVADSGCGMSARTLAKAGRPFFTTKPRGSGTGLGLASAFELADTLGGRVVLASKEGEGTSVKLYLPRAGVRDAVTKQDELALTRLHGAATILLVYRDDGARGALSLMLRTLDYVVVEASSVEMALGLAAGALKVELLIYDADTGRDAGFALTQQLRRDRPELAVIRLRNATESAPGIGEVWLRKPVYEPLLLRTVLEQLGRLPAVTMTPAMLQTSERLRARLKNAVLRDPFDQWFAISRSLSRLPALTGHPGLSQVLRGRQSYLVEIADTGQITQFRLRHLGADLVDRLGRDITDLPLTSGEEALLGSQRQAYQRCSRGFAHFDYARMKIDPRNDMLFERLLLPLSDNGLAVTHMLGLVSISNVGGRR